MITLSSKGCHLASSEVVLNDRQWIYMLDVPVLCVGGTWPKMVKISTKPLGIQHK